MKSILKYFFVSMFICLIFVEPVFATSCEEEDRLEAIEYWKQYGFDLSDTSPYAIQGIGPKYTDDANEIAKRSQYMYSITYITRGNEICYLYLNELPKDFNIWNTDILINDGRIVVTGMNGDDITSWNTIYSKYKTVIIGISGLGALTCVLAFIMFFIKMGSTVGNPGERSKMLSMLLFTGLGATGLGAVTIIFGFFWNLI